MTARKLTDLTTRIDDDLANNNAGLISAADVRENMKDVAESITTVVGSGDFDAVTPFLKNVRIKVITPICVELFLSISFLIIHRIGVIHSLTI